MAPKTILYRDRVEDDGTYVDEIELPTRWAICDCCRGEGKSSLYLGAITQEDREPGGSWEDPDDFRAYMRGEYDCACDECGGSGKVKVVDEAKIDADTLKAWQEQCRDDADYESLRAAERRMGA